MLVQSVGNYADAAMHTHARVGPDQQHVLDWVTPERRPHPQRARDLVQRAGRLRSHPRLRPTAANSRWRSTIGCSSATARACGATSTIAATSPTADSTTSTSTSTPRRRAGAGSVVLRGRDVVDGRLHAWIERDASGRYQSRFPRSQATSQLHDQHDLQLLSRDRRRRVRRHAARPAADPLQQPRSHGGRTAEAGDRGARLQDSRRPLDAAGDGWRGEPRLCVKSGTSMAAPWVSGTVALMLRCRGRPLTIHEVRRALIGTADPHPGPSGRTSTQLGYGYLNTAAAVDGGAPHRRAGEGPAARRPPPPMEEGDVA